MDAIVVQEAYATGPLAHTNLVEPLNGALAVPDGHGPHRLERGRVKEVQLGRALRSYEVLAVGGEAPAVSQPRVERPNLQPTGSRPMRRVLWSGEVDVAGRLRKPAQGPCGTPSGTAPLTLLTTLKSLALNLKVTPVCHVSM